MSKQNMPSDELVKIAVAALEEIKATDITVIDVKEKTSITDFMVIASGRCGLEGPPRIPDTWISLCAPRVAIT